MNISEILQRTAARATSRSLTISELLERLGNNGYLILCMMLVIPFLIPVSIPGTSTPFGVAIALIGLHMLADKPLLLPRRIREHRLSDKTLELLLTKGSRIFHRIENWSKPRLLIFCSTDIMRRINGLLLVSSGLLLMAPLPLPFSNTLPAYGVLFLAGGTLLRDGLLLLAGYLMVVLTLIYFTVVYLFGMSGLKMIFSNLN